MSLDKKCKIAWKFGQIGASFYATEAVKKYQGLESFRLSGGKDSGQASGRKGV